MNVVIIGGGAAGFFAAIHAALNPELKVYILERTNQILSKVKISGGGRCNVTHACFEKEKLVLNYPRGQKELLGPFSRFNPTDTIRFFEERGVALKVEPDGRMFPVTNSSQTIIDCLQNEAKRLNVTLKLQQKIEKIGGDFVIHFEDGEVLPCECLVLATGSSKHGYQLAESFSHSIVPPVPSLFTFHSPTSPLLDLSGIAVQNVELSVETFKTKGPLLLTHFGFSGPALLKLSAFAARALHAAEYKATLSVNWLPNESLPLQSEEKVISFKGLPKQLWRRFCEIENVDMQKRWDQLSKKDKENLSRRVHKDTYAIDGKTPNKEEFVTAGGINLKEVNFKTFESKLKPNLFFAGEILDIDGVTGGFNFQNAWTSGYLAGTTIAQRAKGS